MQLSDGAARRKVGTKYVISSLVSKRRCWSCTTTVARGARCANRWVPCFLSVYTSTNIHTHCADQRGPRQCTFGRYCDGKVKYPSLRSPRHGSATYPCHKCQVEDRSRPRASRNGALHSAARVGSNTRVRRLDFGLQLPLILLTGSSLIFFPARRPSVRPDFPGGSSRTTRCWTRQTRRLAYSKATS